MPMCRNCAVVRNLFGWFSIKELDVSHCVSQKLGFGLPDLPLSFCLKKVPGAESLNGLLGVPGRGFLEKGSQMQGGFLMKFLDHQEPRDAVSSHVQRLSVTYLEALASRQNKSEGIFLALLVLTRRWP